MCKAQGKVRGSRMAGQVPGRGGIARSKQDRKFLTGLTAERRQAHGEHKPEAY